MKKSFLLLTSLLVGTSVFGYERNADTIAVTGIHLNKINLLLERGVGEDLIATIIPADASNQEMTWLSSEPQIATVISATGLVTAVSAGTTVITVHSADGGFSATCIVTVTSPTDVEAPLSAEVCIFDNVLYVNTPESETVDVYSITGALLLHVAKPAGILRIPLAGIPDGVLLIQGSSGWVKKAIN